MQIFPDSFSHAPDARAIGTRLIAKEQEFAHLELARIAYLFSERELWLHGGPKAAIVADPRIQGTHRWLFDWMLAQLVREEFEGYKPDFLVYIDRALWDGMDDLHRERLVFHELKHIQPREDEDGTPRLDDEGRPMLKLVPHDAEVFNSEIARYGVEVCGIEETAVAIAEGEANRRARARGRTA